MKSYSNLSISEKINFKSFCVAQRYALYGNTGFTPLWFAMNVDGITMDVSLLPHQYERPYIKGDIKYKKGYLFKQHS